MVSYILTLMRVGAEKDKSCQVLSSHHLAQSLQPFCYLIVHFTLLYL